MKTFKNLGLFLILSFILLFSVFFGIKSYDSNLGGENEIRFLKREIKKENMPMDNISKSNVTNNRSVKIIFTGDLMLDRYSRDISKRNGIEHFTKNIQNIFIDNDLNITNLEGPVTTNQSVAINTEVGDPAHFKFTFDKEMSKNFLVYNKINIVNLGNNHILNFGESGATETVEFLKENKIEYLGSPLDEKNAYIEKEINGQKIALVSYNRFYKLGSENTINKIKDAKSKNDRVIVYAHWGNEYELIQSEAQQKIAHSFIEVGADLIIGSHPHVVQPVEIYKNKVIFYSLGNFVFDQFFSEDVRTELIVLVSLSEDKMEFVLTPVYRRQDGSLELSDEEKRKKLLQRIANDSTVSELIKEKIIEGKFETAS